VTQQLRIADIARLRGCTPAQIGTWRSQSAPGKRLEENPFPAPDGQDGRSPVWNVDRADELAAWEPTARAIAAAEAPAEPAQDGVQTPAEAPTAPDPAAAARDQQRPRRFY
jgi:hypothetical protein